MDTPQIGRTGELEETSRAQERMLLLEDLPFAIAALLCEAEKYKAQGREVDAELAELTAGDIARAIAYIRDTV